MSRRIFLLTTLTLAACSATERAPRVTGANHDLGGGTLDFSVGDDEMTSSDDGPLMSSYDLYGIESGTIYGDLAINGDASGCVPGEASTMCPNELAPNAGCGPVEICGNGIDDDCDGYVDSYPPGNANSCPCTPGAVQKCFLGPPAKRNIGACTDGHQTCTGNEFGIWGPCTGTIGPTPEVCDKLDNDCDGCVDDGLCCNGNVLDCPAPGDPRIAPVAPYSDLALKGEQFFTATAKSWSWTVTGGPCDQLFASASFTPATTPPAQSFTLTGATTQDASVHFTLSGDYTVTMTVVDANNMSYTCKWIQHVEGPGVRFELCWDHQGSQAQGGADLDLHVHKSASTATWGSGTTDCYFGNCTAPSYFVPALAPNWYGQSPVANCSGANNGSDWALTPGKDCYNPRLDNDNVNDVGVPENTNIDDPKNGDSFRALVHYFGQDGGSTSTKVEEQPLVNIYCGGNLLATYQLTSGSYTCPSGFTSPNCFNNGSGSPTTGLMWRVADVIAAVDGSGNTSGCTINAIHPPSTTSGFYVTNNNNTF